MSKRTESLEWWNCIPFGEQFYKTIECNHLIVGDCNRHPKSLTGREIELIYDHFMNKSK